MCCRLLKSSCENLEDETKKESKKDKDSKKHKAVQFKEDSEEEYYGYKKTKA